MRGLDHNFFARALRPPDTEEMLSAHGLGVANHPSPLCPLHSALRTPHSTPASRSSNS